MIEPGETAFLKTTGEEVFVLRVHPLALSEYPGLRNYKVEVRRPVLTHADGVQHRIEFFFVDELESADERQRRQTGNIGDIIESVRTEVRERMHEMPDVLPKTRGPVS